MRAVVDTNVLVSGLIRPRGAIGRVIRDLRDRRYTAIVSRPMLEELVDVLARPHLRRKYAIDDAAVATFLRFLLLRGELVRPAVSIARCRDPKDDRFLEAAMEGRAERLVTGDADLLALERHGDVLIVSPAAFVGELD